MIQTFAHLYDSHDDALRAVQALEAAGIPHDDISLVANNVDSRYPATNDTVLAEEAGDGAATGAGTGATIGTLVGGGAGLLAGIGALAIPGVGPIVAAGWLIATLTGAGVGAGAGSLIGSLTGAGVSAADAEVHAEGIRRGGSLVTVRADETKAAAIHGVFGDIAPVDVAARRAEYQTDGWTGFDAAAPAYDPAQVELERSRRVRVS